MSAPVEVEVGRSIGARVDRKEDKKLLMGQAQWVDNMRVPGMVYLGVVRSPYAHARITKVNVTPALAHAEVIAAWTGADLDAEWAGSLPRSHHSGPGTNCTARDGCERAARLPSAFFRSRVLRVLRL